MTGLSLFFFSALAATLLPGGSEVLFIGLLSAEPENAFWFWVLASTGNTLGALITFVMGGFLYRWTPAPKLRYWQRWFHLNPTSIERLRSHGPWLLLLSWVPLIGDGFCLAAGYLGWSKPRSFLLIFIGKTLRYGLIWWWLL